MTKKNYKDKGMGSDDGAFFKTPDKEDEGSLPEEKKSALTKKFPSFKKDRLGKVESIRGGKIIINVDGNGEMIDFDEKLHSELKVGDDIRV